MKKLITPIKILFSVLVTATVGISATSAQAIQGRVVDEKSKPIVGAAVVLLQLPDSALISSTLTDINGHFMINKKADILYFSMLGYKSRYIPVQTTLDDIVLQASPLEASTVVVTAQKRPIEFKNGNLYVNISAMPGANIDNMATMLKKMPGVNISSTGIELNGKSVEVQIDGRKQMLSGVQLVAFLEALPSSSMDQVELITATTARHDANAGQIINLKTKSKRMDGYYLSFGTDGTIDRNRELWGGGNTFFMFKKNRVTLNASFSYGNRLNAGTGYDSTQYSTNAYRTYDNSYSYRSNIYIGDFNLAWDIKNGNTLSFNFFVYDEYANSAGHKLGHSSTSGKESYSKTAKNHDDMWSVNIEYKSNDSLRNQFSASYGLLWGGIRSWDNYDNKYPNRDELFSGIAKMNGVQHIFKFGYDHFFGRSKNTKLSVGAKATFGEIRDTSNYTPRYINSSHFKANEAVYATYAEVDHKFSKNLSGYLGVRGELTNYQAHEIGRNNDVHQNYFDIFPYIGLSYNVSKNYRGALTLAGGLSRPNYMSLMPSVTYIDDNNYRTGNPNLKPSYFYYARLSNWFMNFISFSITNSYYRGLNGAVKIYKGDHVTEHTFMNVSDYNTLFANLSVPFELVGRKLRGSLSLAGAYDVFFHTVDGYNIAPQFKYTLYGFLSFYANYEIVKGLNVNMYAYWSSPRYAMGQQFRSSYVTADAGVSYSFLKNEMLTVTFNVMDVFNSKQSNYNYIYDGVNSFSNNMSNSQQYKLSLMLKLSSGRDISDKARRGGINDASRFKKD